MDVFVIGLAGRVGRLLVPRLRSRGDVVRGLVGRPHQQVELARQGVETHVGDLDVMTVAELAAAFGRADAIVFGTGSDEDEADGDDGDDGVARALRAARLAGVDSFALVTVLPHAGREQDPGDDVGYHYAATTEADIALSRTDLSWLMIRPSMLLDPHVVGTAPPGPVEVGRRTTRADAAAGLAALLHPPHVAGPVLDLDRRPRPAPDAAPARLGAP